MQVSLGFSVTKVEALHQILVALLQEKKKEKEAERKGRIDETSTTADKH